MSCSRTGRVCKRQTCECAELIFSPFRTLIALSMRSARSLLGDPLRAAVDGYLQAFQDLTRDQGSLDLLLGTLQFAGTGTR